MIEQSKEKIFGLLYEKQMRELDFFYELWDVLALKIVEGDYYDY
jgi:hypothetical protein